MGIRTFTLAIFHDSDDNQTCVISGRNFFKREILPRINRKRIPYSQEYTLIFARQTSLPIYRINCKRNEFINKLIDQMATEGGGVNLVPVRILAEDRLYLEDYIPKLPEILVRRLWRKGLIKAKTDNGHPVIFAHVESN